MGSDIKRGGAKKPRHFVAYGGPENGLTVRLKNRANEYVSGDRRYTKSLSFHYVLAEAPDGRTVLVPMEDHDLRDAWHDAEGIDDHRAADALKGELKRRGLR